MENLKISFLGGVGEIGKNMTVFEYGKDMIILDSGLAFPDEAMPGVDLVVQDLTYVVENKSKLRGIFITHGHEDHIGSINYLLDNVKAPIYGSRVSLGLIENKIKEAKKSNVMLKSVQAGSVIVAGNFKVEFVPMTHSIPGAMAMVITTPAGVVVHSGDFKIDFTPIGKDYCDLKRLSEIGKKGVTLLMCESTNVEREGFSMSESVVGKTFDELFSKLKTQRIIIATFASNIHRLQQIIDLAVKYKRKIAFTGRSMVNVSDMAIKIGELKCDKDIIVDIDKIENYEDKELIIISTGSQGESMSALTRMASDNFPKVKLNKNDTVIISAAPIPGNEKAINIVINNLYRKDCQVIYNELADVHASGHAYKEELKILHSLIKPKFFIPVHGEYRHLKNHQNLVKELGMKERNTIIPEIGMQVEVNRDVMKIVGTVPAGEILIDGTGVGDKDSNVIRDRLLLGQDGVCAVVCLVSSSTKQLICPPDIISRGFIYQDEASEIITEARETIFKNLNNLDLKSLDNNELKATIRKVSTNFFFKKTKRKPVVLSIVTEVDVM
ncbi:MAG: ribonuclease J [Clostridia bacterium]|nr:ribonuclease J [Clostridia bacterium]